MTGTVPQTVLFPDLFDKPLVAKFNQEQASSDGGAVLLKAAERVYGLVKAFARCLSDKRAPEKIRHTLADLIGQRIFGIACGHPDCNDAEHLADDPIHKLLLGRDSVAGESLASQPTLSRFENAAGRGALYDMGCELAARVVERHRRRLGRVRRITIDLDPTDDPTHGAQQYSLFNGYYCRVRALADAQVRGRGLRVHDSVGALDTVQQEVGIDKRTGEVITKPGTTYRFRGGDGDMHTMAPDPGWGSAPRGLPPQAAPPSRTDPSTLTGPAAREHLAGATAAARRALAERESELQRANDAINDPRTAITSSALKACSALADAVDAAEKDVGAAGRRAILRSRPAAFEGDSEPSWQHEELKRRWISEFDDWRRMVAPDLLHAIPAPRRIRESPALEANASYVDGAVNINNFHAQRDDGPRAVPSPRSGPRHVQSRGRVPVPPDGRGPARAHRRAWFRPARQVPQLERERSALPGLGA